MNPASRRLSVVRALCYGAFVELAGKNHTPVFRKAFLGIDPTDHAQTTHLDRYELKESHSARGPVAQLDRAAVS